MSLLQPISARRSPRAFDPAASLDDAQLEALLEAARWAPSAMNRQPWRFLVARQGDPAFPAMHAALAEGNQVWADKAAALIVALVDTEDEAASTDPGRAYEVGLAVGQLGVQAAGMGLVTHQMGGFSRTQLSAEFGIPARFRPLVVIAVGAAGDPALLPERLRDREAAPRVRKDLAEIAFESSWGAGLGDQAAAEHAA